MNPAFEPTALMGAPTRDWQGATRNGKHRLMLAAGSTLAMLALGLAVVAAVVARQDGNIALFALAAAACGFGMLREGATLERRRDAELGLVDEPTGLLNERGLRSYGDAMLQEARNGGRPVSLVVFDFEDLAEVREIYGRETSRRLLAQIVRKVRSIAGSRGIAARSGRSQFTVVLAGAERDDAQAAVQRVLGKPSRIEFDAGEAEIVLVPDIVCATVPLAVIHHVADVHHAASAELALQRSREQRRQQWLQRERERHSRPPSHF